IHRHAVADYVDFLDAVYREAAAGGARGAAPGFSPWVWAARGGGGRGGGGAPRGTALGFWQGVGTACRWIAMGKSRVDRLIAWAGQLPHDVDPSVYAKLPGGLTLVAGTTDEYSSWIPGG